MDSNTRHQILWILSFTFLVFSNAFAANHTVNLVVSYKTVNFAGKTRQAMAVNNQIPAPTLHFKQGDHVTINVYNRLDKNTSMHWHGVLVPWQMDGVEGVSQMAIPPGGVFHYHFTLYQSGTYWYHAHADIQEQEGLYGAFLIDPPHSPAYKYSKDYVVVLSDWSNTSANKVFANLKKDGDYYAPKFPLQPSLMRFFHDYDQAKTPEQRKQVLNDYKMMQQMRMSIYDLSDVAYDAFLLNGQPSTHPWTAPVRIGDVVRLRFIGASGSTNYHVKIPGATMEMVHVQGNDIKPYTLPDFWIMPGETYDVLVKIQQNKPYIIYAESADTLSAAVGTLITSPKQAIPYQQVIPFPEPQPVTQEMMTNMMMPDMKMDPPMNMTMPMNMSMPINTNHGTNGKAQPTSKMAMNPSMNMQSNSKILMNQNMNMNMSMPTEPSIKADVITSPSSPPSDITHGTKYQNLIAAVKTNDPDKPVKVIRMELFGYMNHFIWFINGTPEYKAQPILIEPGKRYRIIFTNTSMMHHPMHIHGHWFILRNGHGAYDPLLHTIDVPPGATAVADVDGEASGQWFFHCHHIFHMLSGMSRVFRYTTLIEVVQGEVKPENTVAQQPYINRPIVRIDGPLPIDPMLIHHPMAHPEKLYLANFLSIGEDPFHNIQSLTFKGLYGGDYNKLELFSNDAELNKGSVEAADLDIFYWRLISQFWAIKGGVNYFNQPSQTPYWQPGIGIEGLLPYFIDTDARTYYHQGSVKFDVELSRDTQITNNFFIRTGIRSILATATVTEDEIGSGLNQMRYIISPFYRLAPGLNVFTEYEYEQDYGDLKNIRRNIGESTTENRITFGVAVIL